VLLVAAREPYRTHRQQHLADFLDLLQGHGWITWELVSQDSPTLFRIAERGSPPTEYRTWEAENLAQLIADKEGIPWMPVPYPGGLDRYEETIAKIAGLKSHEHGDLKHGE
jgi:hypothetical protein